MAPDLCGYCGHDEDEHRSDGQGGVTCSAWPDDGTENCDCFVADDDEPDGYDEGDEA